MCSQRTRVNTKKSEIKTTTTLNNIDNVAGNDEIYELIISLLKNLADDHGHSPKFKELLTSNIKAVISLAIPVDPQPPAMIQFQQKSLVRLGKTLSSAHRKKIIKWVLEDFSGPKIISDENDKIIVAIKLLGDIASFSFSEKELNKIISFLQSSTACCRTYLQGSGERAAAIVLSKYLFLHCSKWASDTTPNITPDSSDGDSKGSSSDSSSDDNFYDDYNYTEIRDGLLDLSCTLSCSSPASYMMAFRKIFQIDLEFKDTFLTEINDYPFILSDAIDCWVAMGKDKVVAAKSLLELLIPTLKDRPKRKILMEISKNHDLLKLFGISLPTKLTSTRTPILTKPTANCLCRFFKSLCNRKIRKVSEERTTKLDSSAS